MSRTLKRALVIAVGAVGFLALVLLAVLLLVDLDRFKPQWEATASDALGMRVHIGRLGKGLFPAFHITVEDGQVLTAQGATVASTKRARLWIRLLPLLRGQLRLGRIELERPTLFVERDLEGRFNVEPLVSRAVVVLGTLDGARVSLSDGTVRYADSKSGGGFEARGCDLAVRRMRLADTSRAGVVKSLSLEAQFACREFRTKGFPVTELNASVRGEHGVFDIQPVTARLFGGRVDGRIKADLSESIPRVQVRGSLKRFRIEEFLATLHPEKSGEGDMDFSASMSMEGSTVRQLVQTMAGEISLRGDTLTLVGNDLDAVLSRFDASQNFNLVDVGAVFFAGPIGLAVTKGYSFATLFQGPGGRSRIRMLVSDWRVVRGVARAHDVALATSRNRIALQGALDFVDGRFVDVTVAVIDAKGCARARQKITGPFGKPVVEKPHVLASLAGPVVGLYSRARGLFPEGPCEVFYSGSVPPPQ